MAEDSPRKDSKLYGLYCNSNEDWVMDHFALSKNTQHCTCHLTIDLNRLFFISVVFVEIEILTH